jgi:hypothetical protein
MRDRNGSETVAIGELEFFKAKTFSRTRLPPEQGDAGPGVGAAT